MAQRSHSVQQLAPPIKAVVPLPLQLPDGAHHAGVVRLLGGLDGGAAAIVGDRPFGLKYKRAAKGAWIFKSENRLKIMCVAFEESDSTARSGSALTVCICDGYEVNDELAVKWQWSASCHLYPILL